MLQETNTQIGHDLLKMAHETADSGSEVFASVFGIGRLWVHKVEFMDDKPLIAKVFCWSGSDGKSVSWLIPLAAVRGVMSEDR